MSSHIVTLLRKPNATNLPDELYAESKRKIGSVYTSGGDIIRGLTFSEQKQFLPEIIGISPADVSFTREVKDFYLNFTVEVPMGGMDLEVGTDDKDHPLNMMDFIRYKFAMAHPYVAKDEESMTGNRRQKYYIKDGALELQDAIVSLGVRKKSYKEFIKLVDNNSRMDMVLRIYGHDPKEKDAQQKELLLEGLQEDNPEYFIQVVTDKHLEMTALINQSLSCEALRKVGNSILDGDIVLGESMEGAVLFLKDNKNSNILTALKAKLRAFG